MNTDNKMLFRLIARIHERLARSGARQVEHLRSAIQHAISEMHRLEALHRRLDMCSSHDFQLTAHRTRERIPGVVADIEEAIQVVHQILLRPVLAVPTPRELLLELQQVQREFGQYIYEPDDQTLSVETDPIELEGVALGPFRIVLNLSDLGTRHAHSALKVIALEPNPASGHDSITHPHVSDEGLCAGDATAALGAAISSGRLADAFVIVRSVLTHYNPGSPYVALDRWVGTPCNECGYVVTDEDNLYSCQDCEESICSECIVRCRCCDSDVCPGCSQRCPVCDDSCCKSCLETCDHCGRDLCHHCKVDGLCSDCLEKMENDHEQEIQEAAVNAEA